MKRIENLDIGHTKHGFDKRFNVKIADVFEDKSLETDFPHRHNFYMVCLVIRGVGTHVIDFERIDIKPNRLFFLKPEQVHFWETEPNSKLAVVQFSEDYLTELFQYKNIPAINSSFDSFIDLQPDMVNVIFEIMQKVETENAQNRLHSNKIIQASIFILLSEIERMLTSDSNQRTKSNKNTIPDQFKSLLNNKYKEVTTVSQFANLLSITPNYLNMIVKETTGLTANELVNKRLFLKRNDFSSTTSLILLKLPLNWGSKMLPILLVFSKDQQD